MRLRRLLVFGLTTWAVSILVLIGLGGCHPTANESPALLALADPPKLDSASCAACHAEAHAAWSGTDHALANRAPGPAELAALNTFPGEAPEAREGRGALILGNKPLWQPLIPAAGGRWQAHEIAFDPTRGDWFKVVTDGRQAGEWGHWTGRGMNWNTMCAPCHMTGYDAGYNPATDTFHPKWIEQGVGCVQCHGTPPAGHGRAGAPAFDHFRADRQKMMQTCAPCHARNEPLTGSFKPGDLYHDHYRVTLPVQPGLFYPDGQQRDEVFNWTSVLTSRMGHAGVSCLDCHDPHTNKPILPVQNNALCMQCHSTPGRVMPGGTRAQVIDPLSHSRHAEGSAGNSCVACHMPTTNYMERAPRHDHGWLKPDPLLTKELGIPNSCSKCHEKEGIDWVIAKADEWYGPKLDSRQRARARAIAAAQARDPASVGLLLSLLKDEDIPAWRATYLDLLAPAGAEAEVRSSLERALGASDPLERSSAVRGLSRFPAARPLLRPLLADPVRLVRLDAALTLTDELPAESGLRRELDAYLALSLDQPSGLTRFSLDLANRGRLDEAVVHVSRAVAWDATSPDMFETLAQLELARRRPAAAAARFAESARLAPTEAVRSFHAALAYAEAGLGSEAEGQLREAIRRDPGLARAWYNLGLLLARRGASADALAALAGAEKAAPGDADYPYATATILWQSGRHEDARNAARRALALNPGHQPALQILRLKP